MPWASTGSGPKWALHGPKWALVGQMGRALNMVGLSKVWACCLMFLKTNLCQRQLIVTHPLTKAEKGSCLTM